MTRQSLDDVERRIRWGVIVPAGVVAAAGVALVGIDSFWEWLGVVLIALGVAAAVGAHATLRMARTSIVVLGEVLDDLRELRNRVGGGEASESDTAEAARLSMMERVERSLTTYPETVKAAGVVLVPILVALIALAGVLVAAVGD